MKGATRHDSSKEEVRVKRIVVSADGFVIAFRSVKSKTFLRGAKVEYGHILPTGLVPMIDNKGIDRASDN